MGPQCATCAKRLTEAAKILHRDSVPMPLFGSSPVSIRAGVTNASVKKDGNTTHPDGSYPSAGGACPECRTVIAAAKEEDFNMDWLYSLPVGYHDPNTETLYASSSAKAQSFPTVRCSKPEAFQSSQAQRVDSPHERTSIMLELSPRTGRP
ncbi:hypothetical protein BJ508DRAFT_303601 [Ascobolus immersus RN42]|uniref:Uncharacterized protein n=1 Tax=Ascobolus immersus RN42 TaxID=1160509 RepID=A0A3N4ITB1_ASCIM|nr:hypothetical protein BJ508DRAFT_303601 [Ascobolus immersus RN42]